MKQTILTITLLSIAMSAFSQQEKKTSVELNDRTKFVEVTPRLQILDDTIYHMNSGFRINPEYDVERIGYEDYVIFTYPNFNNGRQVVRDISNLQNFTADSSVTNPVNKELVTRVNDTLTLAINGKTFAMKKSEFDLVKQTTYYSVSFKKWKNYNFSSGLMTVPFKLRPKVNDSTEFNLTTDITLGGYFGITKRISSSKRNYITIPATLGLSYININDNNTSNVKKDNSIGVVPGITWSTGIIFQLHDFNIGFVLGQDYASSVGDKWIYNGKTWYSFAIGYNFLTQK
jgi:hypothetical protein